MNHLPSDVGEEYAAVRVVRIRIRVGPFVMQSVVIARISNVNSMWLTLPMIVGPLEDAVLAAQRLHDHECKFETGVGLVRLVRPQTVRAAGDAERCKVAQRQG